MVRERDRVRRTCCSHLNLCSEAYTCLSTVCAVSHGMLFVPHYVVQCATSVAMSTVLTRLCRSVLFSWTAANTHGPQCPPWSAKVIFEQHT